MLDRSLSSSAALSAFAEPFIKSRRVIGFGNALSALPRLMLDRGEETMLAIRNFGEKSLDELKSQLRAKGFLRDEEEEETTAV